MGTSVSTPSLPPGVCLVDKSLFLLEHFILGVFHHNLRFLCKHKPLLWLSNPDSLWKWV